MLSDAIAKIQIRERSESDIKLELLLLLVSHPIKFLAEIPDWSHCVHIDLAPDENWLEEPTLRVLLNTLVGSLAHSGRRPIEICAVKNAKVYSIVVRTEEPALAAA